MNLTELRSDMWSEELVTLKVLSISSNKITRIEPGAFQTPPKTQEPLSAHESLN